MARKELFSFVFRGCPEDTFSVVGFTGTEGLSQLYEFQIELVSKRDDLDLDQAHGGLAVLTLRREDKDLPIHGAVSRFEQLRSVDGYVFYRAVLVPRLWRLTLTSHNQVFLDKSAPDFLAEILKGSNILFANDFEFRLTRGYAQREYVCQFNESHYQFFTRWLEREGMYYFFEQGDQSDKLIITDTSVAHSLDPDQPPLEYVRGRGLDTKSRNELCTALVSEQNALPGKVKVKDYNYRKPSLDLRAEADIDAAGIGDFYVYGDNFKTMDEARQQSAIRAEEAKCRKTRYKGRSTAAFLRTGSAFRLNGHFRESANAEYLPVYIKHEGTQTGYLMSGLGRCLSDREAKDAYSNTFSAIPKSVQYRHPRKTPWPRFYGVINAVIDAEGGGQYAELDEQGRYKVRLPFDLSSRPGGKASSWIRMAQPYGGDGFGMHFPLHKGAEVLLTFIDGDVDRPVIASAVPNFANQSIVRDTNAPASAIRSAGGNQLVFGDKQGQEFIGLYSPFHESGIAVGSTEPGGGGSIIEYTNGKMERLVVGDFCSATVGGSNSITVGESVNINGGLKSNILAGLGVNCNLGNRVTYNKGSQIRFGDTELSIKNESTQIGLDNLVFKGGTTEVTAELVKKANKALWQGLGASLAAGAGVVLAANSFQTAFLNEAKMEQATPWMAVGGGLAGICGIGLAISAYRNISEIAEQLRGKMARHTTVMKLGKVGLTVNVDASVNAGAEFSATVVNDTNRSIIQIYNKGEIISLINKDQNCSISLNKGNSIDVVSKETTIEGKNTLTLKAKDNIKIVFKTLNAENAIKITRNRTIELA
ncbi:type VI secretion system Vgr family protein [Desulfonatronum sp. SC1]|uniref:type VI secretion system Vgr family protein n=1 Tax=Desulfonatronum sp. SC1 TaxID=2109626 RepID=UPI000D3208BB|nr:type VI secretion system tip protein TssI/VgrG [Desulfonatronum sp. SC1]PTN36015.1 type VI secretion system tip protein VgrG [Desulfonatronum sp. SC1]